MKYLFGLAFKNLTRYKRRTIITALAIAYGLAMFIFMDSLLMGAEKSSETNLFEYETGSAQIYAPGYFKERLQMSTKYLIEEPFELIRQLKEAGVDNATPRLTVGAELINENTGSGQRATLIGIDLDRDESVFSYSPTIQEGNEETQKQIEKFNNNWGNEAEKQYVEGRYLEKGDEGIVLGGWLAEELKVYPGDYVSINFNMRPMFNEKTKEWDSGSFSSVDVEVIGLVKTGNPIVNRNYAMIDRDYLDDLVMAEGGASSIVLRFPENGKGKKQFEKATEVVAGYFDVEKDSVEVESLIKHWRDLVASYLALTATKRGSSMMVLALIALIAAVGISNTMMMSVIERKREIGMMRAMGMSKGEILGTFVIEAGGIGVIGAVSGIMLGSLVNIWLVNWGIDYGFILRDFDVGYRIADIFKGAWNVPTMIIGGIFTVVITAVFAIFPALKSLKQPIPETLRVE